MILDILAARAVVRLALHLRAEKKEQEARQLEELAGLSASQDALRESAAYLNALRGGQDGYETLQRLRHLTRSCELDGLGETALEFAIAWALLPQLGGLIGEAQTPLTLERVVVWGELPYSFSGDFLYLEQTAQKLGRIVELQPAPQPLCRQAFAADARLLGYLCGGSELPPALASCCSLLFWDTQFPMPQSVHDDAITALTDGLLRAPQGWFQIFGSDAAEQKYVVEQACVQSSLDLLFVDFAKLPPAERMDEFLWSAERELLFYKMGACLCGVSASAAPAKDAHSPLAQWLGQMERQPGAMFFCTQEGTVLLPAGARVLHRLAIPDYTRADRIALWQEFCLLENQAGKIDCVDAGSRYKLTRSEIHKAVLLLAEQETVTPQLLAKVCAEVLPPPSQGNLKKIAVSYTLEDLKLPPEQKRVIENICSHVRYRHLVYDEWNMESRYAYGRNVSALFVGPPGTGKTMAVHVLSNMLDIPLYQINLSQVVDKYIGETEKRLEEIFNIAEKSNSILFFDEADSIFGKRSEVNDAKDKYANTEVSYILQRIEQYDGIVILATNYKKNIDEAFMRRMRYLVEFTLPGEALRGEIWRGAFSPEVPLDGVDFAYLARQFELSGGSIKNVVLNAAFLAAQEEKPVGMKHILTCIRSENAKMGKPMLRQDFAEYGALLD